MNAFSAGSLAFAGRDEAMHKASVRMGLFRILEAKIGRPEATRILQAGPMGGDAPDLEDRFVLLESPQDVYMVDGWFRVGQPQPPAPWECDSRAEHAILSALFAKSHPNPEREQCLVDCLRAEATHVAGTKERGKGSILVSLDTVKICAEGNA